MKNNLLRGGTDLDIQNMIKKTKPKKLQPKAFIIGYGSIINSNSRSGTGGKNIGNAIPVRIKKEAGLKRVWNFQKPSVAKLTALGLQQSDGATITTDARGVKTISYEERAGDTCEPSTINGVLYPVFDNIDKFDDREEGYFRLKINPDQIVPIGWQRLPQYDGCDFWVYCLNKENQNQRPEFDYPILQTYVDVCLNGCLEYGEDFTKEFITTTGGWSEYWLNDRLIPRRPWLHESNYKLIDLLLKKLCKPKVMPSMPVRYYAKLNKDYMELPLAELSRPNSRGRTSGRRVNSAPTRLSARSRSRSSKARSRSRSRSSRSGGRSAKARGRGRSGKARSRGRSSY